MSLPHAIYPIGIIGIACLIVFFIYKALLDHESRRRRARNTWFHELVVRHHGNSQVELAHPRPLAKARVPQVYASTCLRQVFTIKGLRRSWPETAETPTEVVYRHLRPGAAMVIETPGDPDMPDDLRRPTDLPISTAGAIIAPDVMRERHLGDYMIRHGITDPDMVTIESTGTEVCLEVTYVPISYGVIRQMHRMPWKTYEPPSAADAATPTEEVLLNAPQKPHPEHLALVQDKLNAHREDEPNWTKWMNRIDAQDVADDLAAAGKFQTIDSQIMLSDADFDEWLVLNQHRYD